MQKAAGQIEQKHQEIHSLQTTLHTQVEDLRRGWVGQASDAFYKAYTQFDSEFEKVKAGLDDIHSKLVDSHVRYNATEQDMLAASNPILGML